MTEQDDKKIRDLLKKSPTLTPPESFYQGVLEKSSARAQKRRRERLGIGVFPSESLPRPVF